MGLWSGLVLREKQENRTFNKKTVSFDFICPYPLNLDKGKECPHTQLCDRCDGHTITWCEDAREFVTTVPGGLTVHPPHPFPLSGCLMETSRVLA